MKTQVVATCELDALNALRDIRRDARRDAAMDTRSERVRVVVPPLIAPRTRLRHADRLFSAFTQASFTWRLKSLRRARMQPVRHRPFRARLCTSTYSRRHAARVIPVGGRRVGYEASAQRGGRCGGGRGTSRGETDAPGDAMSDAGRLCSGRGWCEDEERGAGGVGSAHGGIPSPHFASALNYAKHSAPRYGVASGAGSPVVLHCALMFPWLEACIEAGVSWDGNLIVTPAKSCSGPYLPLSQLNEKTVGNESGLNTSAEKSRGMDEVVPRGGTARWCWRGEGEGGRRGWVCAEDGPGAGTGGGSEKDVESRARREIIAGGRPRRAVLEEAEKFKKERRKAWPWEEFA
ncbi:hypothetical protein DFH09DRAFT_1082464 [Mycena vulgaris]|nr:hypothetical protein DFH09DRAFT_1082464 [Mycena vulgaris]